jgi:uncharacterized protein (TIGR02001 family)
MNNVKKTTRLLAALCVLATCPAWADETGSLPLKTTLTLTSNYLLRGISQTGGRPALQGGVDFTHADTGLYIGVWGSNVSIVTDRGLATGGSSLEADGYVGLKNNIVTDFNYDLGFLWYYYPGSYAATTVTPDTKEIYAALIYQILGVKYSYSLGNTFGIAQAKGSGYLDVSLDWPIADSGVTFGLHYGQQKYKGTGATALTTAGMDPDYKDYRVSLAKEYAGYTIKATYSRTNAAKGVGSYYNVLGNDLGQGVFVFSLNRTF